VGTNAFGYTCEVRDLRAGLLFGRKSAADVTEPTFLDKLAKSAEAIGREDGYLLELVPVCGASILLLAASIEWR
jgi:hypothetical protein